MQLVPHADSLWSPWQVTFEAIAAPGGLRLTYVVQGDIEALVVPAPAPKRRADNLWKHSCFEWFVADVDGRGYSELNFAPSGEWAAYDFEDYRRAMRNKLVERIPSIDARPENGALVVAVMLPWLRSDLAQFGASAVLEHSDGRRAYHALAHQPGDPDFHARACFTGVLGGREGA